MIWGLVKILFVFIACFFEVLIVFCSLTNKYCSPYTLDVYFGKKGCGKSTTLQKLAYKYYKKGWNCFCDRNDSFQPFVKQLDASKLYMYKLPPNSVVFIGEANLHWDNRDFSSFPKPFQKYLRLQRHKRVKIVMFSQTYDTDKKIRDLADRLYIVKKRLRLWTTCTPYIKTPVILPAGETRDTAKMADDFVRIPKFFFSGVITFIPRWVNDFDSFIDDQSDYRLQLSPAAADPPAGGDVTGNARPVPDSSESSRTD